MSGDYGRQTQSWLGGEKGRHLRHRPLTVSVPSSSIFHHSAACTRGRGGQQGRSEPCPSLTSPHNLPELRVRGWLSYQRPVASQLAPSPNPQHCQRSPCLETSPCAPLGRGEKQRGGSGLLVCSSTTFPSSRAAVLQADECCVPTE